MEENLNCRKIQFLDPSVYEDITKFAPMKVTRMPLGRILGKKSKHLQAQSFQR